MVPASLLIQAYRRKTKGIQTAAQLINHIAAAFHTLQLLRLIQKSIFHCKARGTTEAKVAMLTQPDQKDC